MGRSVVGGLEELGHGAALFGESMLWLLVGHRRRQPVRIGAVFEQMMVIGVQAIPIISMLAATIGVMLAIQGIYTLRLFGAESKVTVGIAFAVMREFAPLITGIVIAGRSGAALTARIGTMKINQEIDALRVMGINPVRFLVVPPLLAMMVVIPCLTILSTFISVLMAGVYIEFELGITLVAYTQETIEFIRVADVTHGMGKTLIFSILIAIIAVVNGAAVSGGAEGVGKATTRTVVQSISALILTDMIFAFIVSR